VIRNPSFEIEYPRRVAGLLSCTIRRLTLDHGGWLARIGLSAKARMYTIGNPLIARIMLKYDIAAGLNVPVRLMIYEDAVSRTTRLTYDLFARFVLDVPPRPF
jgi:hypothetical protein